MAVYLCGVKLTVMTIQQQKQLIRDFIDTVWNQGNTAVLEQFLHPGFIDHSLPGTLPANAGGLKQWVEMTHASFIPQTVIEEQVAENNTCIIKIAMHMKHTGAWRGITPTGLTVTTKGYRCFRLQDDRIIAHWGMVDGDMLEKKLLAAGVSKD